MFPVTNYEPWMLLSINFTLGILITLLITPAVIEMIRQSGFLRPNFKGDPIPVGVGMIFLLVFMLAIVIDYLLLPGLLGGNSTIALMGLGIITFLGLVDDTLGSRNASGLKGHFKALFRGQLTTGALKALGGGLLALIITLISFAPDLWELASVGLIIVNTLIIALSINAINLLDLRPGRAGKAFLVVALLITVAAWGSNGLIILAFMAGSVLAYLRWDLKARTMMGDTGSNALGLTIGMTAAWSLDDGYKIIYLLLLIAFHIFTEKYSLTKVIANNKLLNYLDLLGRR